MGFNDKAYAFAVDKPGSYTIKWAVFNPWSKKPVSNARYATESAAARRAYAINIKHLGWDGR